MTYDYDLFVIGAGSGGLAASKRAASYGAKVAIAENDLVGGTCVIRGCIPKKLMVYGSHFPALFRDAAGYGWQVGKAELNWQHFITSIDNEVRRLSQLHIGFLEKAGVALISGKGKLLDPHTVEVGDKKYTADKILIAVGGRPIKPDMPGFEYGITSNEIFHLKEQPKHIVIIGAGYIGTEFACIMRGLGSEVTQITRGEKILKGFDEDVRDNIEEGMEKHGINLIRKNIVKQVEKVPEGLKLTLSDEKQAPIIADTFLVATGRAPNVDGLGLENTGVKLIVDAAIEGPGYSTMKAIAVNEYSQTSQENIYAVGDVTDRINLTPVAIGEGRAFADSEFGGNRRIFSHEDVATAIFSSPEAATVGLTEEQARAKYGDAIKIFSTKFRPMYYVLPGVDEKTMMKLVVDSKTDRVLGAHMVGDSAAEIIQGVAIAVKMGATKKDFDATVGIHPSSAEEFVTMR
jgi:glutathione reductase (NADPH)